MLGVKGRGFKSSGRAEMTGFVCMCLGARTGNKACLVVSTIPEAIYLP